jgi:hypothetical protein
MPTAVLRRYTPPTCTLEIAAAGSALSRWTDRTVLKNLRFQLSFDDPKLPSDRQVVVSGNRTQLEALTEVVTDYVQQLLTATHLPGQGLTAAQPLEPLEPEPVIPSSSPSKEAMGMSLHPQGLLSHQLRLGALATDASGTTVNLTTLQLFDLANVLEEYSAEAVSLPTSGHAGWLTKLPKRWPTVAAVSVLALGATAGIAKFVMDVSAPAPQIASVPGQRQVNSELNSNLFPTLSPPPIEASPSITLQPLPPPPSGTQPNAPGLPPVGVTQAPAPAQLSPAVSNGSNTSNGSKQTTGINPNGTVAALPSESLARSRSLPPRLTGTGEAPEVASTAALAPSSLNEAGSAVAPTPESNRSAPDSSTAFDTIPQVAEIRSYFQQNWQPPKGLTQTLEYRLLLSANGSLQRIVPLGQASENYLDRTNMPLMGEPFVSPSRNGETPQIRLVLEPDGKVRTFLEYAR